MESLIVPGIFLYVLILLIVLILVKPVRRAWKNAQQRKLVADMRGAGHNVVYRTQYGNYRRR